jgi:hypothetical protein
MKGGLAMSADTGLLTRGLQRIHDLILAARSIADLVKKTALSLWRRMSILSHAHNHTHDNAKAKNHINIQGNDVADLLFRVAERARRSDRIEEAHEDEDFTPKQRFGLFLSDLRHKSGLSLTELADHAHLSPEIVLAIQVGEADLDVIHKNLGVLAHVLGVDETYLLRHLLAYLLDEGGHHPEEMGHDKHDKHHHHHHHHHRHHPHHDAEEQHTPWAA